MRSAIAAFSCVLACLVPFGQPQTAQAEDEPNQGKEWKAGELVKMQTVRDEDKFHIAPDGVTVAITTAKGVRLYDLVKNAERAFLSDPKMVVRSLAYSTDSKWLAVCGSETTIWNVGTGKKAASIERVGDALAFHPDKSILAIVDENKSREWDFQTNKIAAENALPVHQDGELQTKYLGCRASYLKPDDLVVWRLHVVQAGGKPVCEYDLITVKTKSVVVSGTHVYPFLYFPQDRKLIVRLTDRDGLARINWKTKKEDQNLKELGYNHVAGWYPNSFASSQNGDTLATYNTDNRVHIWKQSMPKQFDFAQSPNNIMTIGLSPRGDVLQVIMYKDNFFHLQRWQAPTSLD